MHMSAETRESTAKRLFIGGEWADAEDGRTFEDRDPFNSDLVANVAAGSRADAHPAVEAAAAAAPARAQTPAAVRQGFFLRAADILVQRGSHPFPF
jgi:acyl-CoA reductase-like NAD-dependent aldehyde dehydrogenase